VPVSQVAMPVLLPVLTDFVSKNPEYAEAAMAAAMQLQMVS
jgi:hypothetical protein